MSMLATKYPLFKKKKTLSAAILVLIFSLFMWNCVSTSTSPGPDIRGKAYAGSASCSTCHRQIYNEFIRTAHFHTSSDTLPTIVRSAFEKGRNEFDFNDSLKVVMEENNGQYYQTALQNGNKINSHSFDIVIGSGRKAQTYLYYNDNRIFQLPISYFMAEHTWANSPGFTASYARFDRSIPSACFGCHSSFIAVNKTYKGLQLQETFEKGQIAYGIDCERCHGPAAEHVAWYTEHPEEKQVKFITTIRSLNRSQKTDLCAICHSGLQDAQQSLFLFKPGDKLSDFYFPDFKHADPQNLDVHGKQTQLMMASKCYQLSNELTCNSCHNVHVKERENITGFSERCITCHKEVNHSFAQKDKEISSMIQNDCISCHMPLTPSRTITLLTKQQTSATPDYIRNHLIKIYPEATKRFLDSLPLTRKQ